MSFANETPLEDVLKYIKSATAGPHDTGIPIYVDPIGLQEAERTLNSAVQIDLEGPFDLFYVNPADNPQKTTGQ